MAPSAVTSKRLLFFLHGQSPFHREHNVSKRYLLAAAAAPLVELVVVLVAQLLLKFH
jgi:hypothetical protein